MGLDDLLQRVKNAIFDDDKTPYQHGDSGGLIKTIEDIFGGHRNEPGTINNPRPASEDPYGDPADLEPGGYRNSSYPQQNNEADLRRQFPNLRPASEDPLGDPADLEPAQTRTTRTTTNEEALRRQFPNLRPASEDPLGDPADQR